MHTVETWGAVKALTGLDFVSENAQVTIADGIRNPYKYYYYIQPDETGALNGQGGWFTDDITDTQGYLWSNVLSEGISTGMISTIISTKNPTVKTIYDPNPAGFVMPPMDAGGTFFAFFTGGRYENYLAQMGGPDGAALSAKYVSLLISASPYGSSYYASTDKNPAYTAFFPQVGRRYCLLGGQFQTEAFVDVEGNGKEDTMINQLANAQNIGGYYSNFVAKSLAPVMLCSYPNMNFGFLTLSSSALPVRSVVEE